MCGIAAILLRPQVRSSEELLEIRDCFTRNLLSNEERGRLATGLAVSDIRGGIRVCKSPLPASQFVSTVEYQQTLQQIDGETILILGHTRLPTKGDSRWNRNNHPLQAGYVVGVHNGVVTNDDDLFAHGGYRRTAQTDSEIIFRLIESVDPLAIHDAYMSEIQRRIRMMKGHYTFVALDGRSPGCILVLRRGNPLSVHFHEKWNALVFSSRYMFLRKTFGTAMTSAPVEQDQLMMFDATRVGQLGPLPCRKISLQA